MVHDNPVAKEIPAFLAEHNNLAKGCIPFAKLIALYKRYEKQEEKLFPAKRKTQIYEEFSLLCKKNDSWMLSYVRLTKLDPELLELINVRIGPFYLSVAIATLLCNYPLMVQKRLLERAQGLAQERQPWLWYYVEQLGKLYKKGDVVSVPPVPVHYERPVPAPAETAAVTPSPATLPPSTTSLPKTDTLDKKARDNELFLQFLAKAPTIKTRTAEPPKKESTVPEWHGDRRIEEGKKYGGSKAPTEEI
jgi:hypothetical protein